MMVMAVMVMLHMMMAMLVLLLTRVMTASFLTIRLVCSKHPRKDKQISYMEVHFPILSPKLVQVMCWTSSLRLNLKPQLIQALNELEVEATFLWPRQPTFYT